MLLLAPPNKSPAAPSRKAISWCGGAVGVSYNAGSSTSSAPVDNAYESSDAASQSSGSASQPRSLSNAVLTASKILAYGREAATDPALAARLSAKYTAHRRAMPEVLARRRPRPRDEQDVRIPPRVQAEPKRKELDDSVLSAIVDSVREPQPEEVLETLQEETRAAVLVASRRTCVPPSHSASSLVQLRRLRVERAFAGERFSVGGDFTRPEPGAPLQTPISAQGAASGKPSTSLLATTWDETQQPSHTKQPSAWNMF